MRLLIFLAGFVVSSVSAQFVTNNITLVLETNDDATLRMSLNLENNRRTNALPPFMTTNTALTFIQYKDALATEAFQNIARNKSSENRDELIRLYNNAPTAKQAQAMRVLAGKE